MLLVLIITVHIDSEEVFRQEFSTRLPNLFPFSFPTLFELPSLPAFPAIPSFDIPNIPNLNFKFNFNFDFPLDLFGIPLPAFPPKFEFPSLPALPPFPSFDFPFLRFGLLRYATPVVRVETELR